MGADARTHARPRPTPPPRMPRSHGTHQVVASAHGPGRASPRVVATATKRMGRAHAAARRARHATSRANPRGARRGPVPDCLGRGAKAGWRGAWRGGGRRHRCQQRHGSAGDGRSGEPTSPTRRHGFTYSPHYDACPLIPHVLSHLDPCACPAVPFLGASRRSDHSRAARALSRVAHCAHAHALRPATQPRRHPPRLGTRRTAASTHPPTHHALTVCIFL